MKERFFVSAWAATFFMLQRKKVDRVNQEKGRDKGKHKEKKR